MNSKNHLQNLNPAKHAFRISALYFFISTLWIIVTDLINVAYHHNALNELLIDISKGLIFIIITSVLLYFLLVKYFTALQEKHSELYSNEEKYRTLAENLEFCVMRHDLECRYIYVNKAAWEMLRVLLKVKSIEEIIGLTPEEIYKDPAVAKIVREDNEFVISSGKPTSKKLHYGEKYISYSKVPEFDEQGEIITVMTLIADETEITKNLLKLEKSEKFNSHLVNSSHVVVYVFDLKKSSQIYANKALERILGYDLEEIRDPKINILEDLMHPDDAQKMVKYVHTEVMRLNDGEVAEFEYRMKHKDGHYCWFKSHDCVFKRDEQGMPLEILGSAIDISDLKATQDELKRKSDYLVAVIEASPMGIFDLNTKGQVISIWNKASEQMFGWKAEEVIGKMLPIVPEDRKHELIENLESNRQKHQINGKEQHRKKKNGSDIDIRIYSRPVINKRGEVEAILAYNEDITLKKQFDEEVKRNNEYLKTLYIAGIEANSTLDIQELYIKNFALLQRIIPADCIILTSLSEDRKFIKCEGLQIKGESIYPDSFPLIKYDETSGGPQTHAIKTGKPFIVEDYENWMYKSKTLVYLDTDGVQHTPDERSSMNYQPPRSAIIIPLKYNDEVYGVLQIQSFSKCVFSDSDLHKLEPFAALFAMAMQRAVLHRKIQTELAEKVAAFEQVRKFSKGIEQSPNSIVITNSEHEIEYVNPYFTELTGYSADEVMGKNPSILQSGQTKREVYKGLWDTLHRGEIWHGEFLNLKKSGELYWEAAAIGPINDAGGNCTHYIAIKQDITEKKKQDKALKESLVEKEIMLKEIHHRVKNNLQVISSLLNLQSGQYEHPEAIEAIKASHNRVKAMALVHESLYQSRNIGKTPLKEYIHMLSKHIYSSYGVSFDRVNFHCETNGIEFGIDTIIPLGLILNEGISNSLKHGFPGNAPGEIRIDLEAAGNNAEVGPSYEENSCGYRLRIKDNGKGLPPDFNPGKINSLGVTLLTNLAAQLDGEARINNKVGTEIIVNFRELRYKSRV